MLNRNTPRIDPRGTPESSASKVLCMILKLTH